MYINKIISSSQQTWVRIFPFKQLDAYSQQLHQKNFHHMGFTHYSYVYKTYPSIEEVSSKIRELLYCAYRGKLFLSSQFIIGRYYPIKKLTNIWKHRIKLFQAFNEHQWMYKKFVLGKLKSYLHTKIKSLHC